MRQPAPRTSLRALFASIGIAAVAAALGFQFGATRDDGGPDDAQAAEMAAVAAYATPGPMQEYLARKVGRWNAAMQMWAAPGTEPTTATGSGTYTMELGGRYLMERNESMWFGQPFAAMGWTAFDNARNVFEYSWIDTMGTGIARGEGTLSDDGKVLNWKSTMTDPVKGSSATYRGTETWTDADTIVSDMFNTGPDGAEFVMLRIVLTRDKSSVPTATADAGAPSK